MSEQTEGKQPTAPQPSGERFSEAELDHFRKLILERKTEIVEDLDNLREQMVDKAAGEYDTDNSTYSLHMADQGTDAMEREKTFLFAQRENKFLTYLERALERVEAGTYGACTVCTALLDKGRLEAVPHAQVCTWVKEYGNDRGRNECASHGGPAARVAKPKA